MGPTDTDAPPTPPPALNGPPASPGAPGGPGLPPVVPEGEAPPGGEGHLVPSLRIPPSVRPRDVPAGAGLDHPSLYFNRELGWLDFNRRVLEQARDPRTPLLERVRFVGITASNLDEFVQKRIGGLRRQEAAGVRKISVDGRAPAEQLALVRDAVTAQEALLAHAWREELRPALAREAGIRVAHPGELGPAGTEALDRHFRDQIYPLLTPLAVDPGHPFPFISNLSLSLAVELRDPEWGEFHFARVKIPTQVGRWVRVPKGDHGPGAVGDGGELRPRVVVPLEEVVRRNVAGLFRGMEVVGCHLFRVIRNADIRRDEEEAEDLLAMISEELRERRTAPVVRLEVERGMPSLVRELLLRELELGIEDVAELPGELALEGCLELADLDRDDPELAPFRFPPWEPVVPARVRGEGGDGGGAEAPPRPSLFQVMREGDLLVHHPYESFTHTVQRLVEEAAEDPDVLAIKQTLYRTSDDSPIVRALMRGAERGKQVAVLVEVKARFDEQNNIEWARMLENHGVHITYGLVGLKTHAKVLLVVRREGGRPRVYCHVGTGNYHADNARVYTDLGLLTADPDVGADAVDLFHALTGHAPAQRYRKLLVAPTYLRDDFVRLIRGEVKHAEEGRGGRIVAKMNALDDPRIIRELYAASRAGVEVELIVRGHCRLRPGVPGVSERIRVVSLVGRFLEHDRIFLFGNGGTPRVYMGSADWRGRNLDERVEAMVPVEDPALRARLEEILALALADNRLAFDLGTDGSWTRRAPGPGEAERNLHEILMDRARGAPPPVPVRES